MFIFYAIPLGLIAGFLIGGRLDGLASLRLRWWPIAFGGLAAQVVLFSGAVDRVIGDAGPALYVASTLAVLAAVLRNLAVPGLALVAVGAISNLAAIIANGGFMPADPGALALAGYDGASESFSNSVVVENPALRPLTDIFALPEAMPMSNVFSVGDVLIGLGIALTIALAMRRGRPSAVSDPRDDALVRSGNSPD